MINIFGNLKSILITIAIVVVLSMSATIFLLNKKIKKLDYEYARSINNSEFYLGLFNNSIANNRVLRLSVSDLNNSVDSLILKSERYRKQLKIKSKDLKQTQIVNMLVLDSATVIIKRDTTIINKCDFSEQVKLNDMTAVYVQRLDSSLKVKLDLTTDLFGWVSEKKQYRNKYKNIFLRLIHFDFKKDKYLEYELKSSNSLVKIKGARIISIE